MNNYYHEIRTIFTQLHYINHSILHCILLEGDHFTYPSYSKTADIIILKRIPNSILVYGYNPFSSDFISFEYYTDEKYHFGKKIHILNDEELLLAFTKIELIQIYTNIVHSLITDIDLKIAQTITFEDVISLYYYVHNFDFMWFITVEQSKIINLIQIEKKLDNILLIGNVNNIELIYYSPESMEFYQLNSNKNTIYPLNYQELEMIFNSNKDSFVLFYQKIVNELKRNLIKSFFQ